MKIYVNSNYDIFTEEEAYEEVKEQIFDEERYLRYISELDPSLIWDMLSDSDKADIISGLTEDMIENEYYSREF